MALTPWSSLSTVTKSKVQNFLLFCKGSADNEVYPIEVDPATGAIPITGTVLTAPGALHYGDSVALSYGTTPVTSAAYVTLIASTAAASIQIFIFESGGNPMELATGAAGFETRLFLIPPGGINGPAALAVPAGTRLSVKALSTSNTLGDLLMTILKL